MMSQSSFPTDHAQRMNRVLLALDGLSLGDAFGSQFFIPAHRKLLFGPRRELPEGVWRYTDDTEMALGIAQVLERYGTIDQDELARVFARRYALDISRGYGAGAHRILMAIGNGASWRNASQAAFGGQGSKGNGGAMRVAPVGAYFADDLDRVVVEAQRSAEVTHAHPEGIAGAIAAAVAGAVIYQERRIGDEEALRAKLFAEVSRLTPKGETQRGIEHAASVEPDRSIDSAVDLLGNGSGITAPDTLPFCLWCVGRHPFNFTEAIWTVVQGGGDIDTTAAIVAGIVALAVGEDGLPRDWIDQREELQYRVD